MKKPVFVEHLIENGCVLRKNGTQHELWESPKTKKWSIVPRQNEVIPMLCVKICRDLEISSPFYKL